MLWKEEPVIDWVYEAPRERKGLCEWEKTRLLKIGLDNVMVDEQSVIFCENANVRREGEDNCDVSWMASSFNVPEEWNGISFDWTSREHQEIRSINFESKKQMPLEERDWKCNLKRLNVESWNENSDLFELGRDTRYYIDSAQRELLNKYGKMK